MAAAIPVAALGFIIARRRKTPIPADRFSPPPPARIDVRLIAGAALFGISWGLVGFCPGPALAALQSGRHEVFIFVTAMIVGMLAFRLIGKAE
jgi:uncharacterized membrane protein YedE/YeeE